MKPTYEELEHQIEESRREFRAADATIHNLELKITDMAVQLANAERKCRELAAELSAVDKIHNEAAFITDDHYEQCPPEVQKMIRSLAVLQIPAYDAFLAEVRASAIRDALNESSDYLDTDCVMDRLDISYEDAELRTSGAIELHDALVAVANQLRKGE
ncbi:hypothetical protein ACLH09_05615 [Citrobacter braakii]|uniref:hypothetical protein n=1 Tax=Citrobacter braakii TaxID=57706 RepID=UPI003983F253